MQTQFSRHQKVIEHGTRYATCTEYFRAYWQTWSTYANTLPPDLNKWQPQQFSTALSLSIAAGVEACQLYSASPPDFW